MTKIKKLIQRCVLSEELPLSARLTNLVYLVGLVTATVAAVARGVIVNSTALNLVMLTIALSVAVLFYVCNRFSLHTLGSWLTLILLGNVLFPLTFFLLGGVNSGMPAYFVLSIVIIFLLAKGKAMIVLLSAHIVWIAACYYISYRFPWLVTRLRLEQRYLDVIQSFVVSGLFIGSVIKFQEKVYLAEKQKADRTGTALARQGELTRVVNGVATVLFMSDPERFEGALRKGLEMMARCVSADSVHIWKNITKNGTLRYTELLEWQEGGGLRRATPDAMDFSYKESLPQWEARLSAGQNVNGPVDSFEERERARLKPYGIRSILVLPVFLQNEFWGFISFDDCHKERVFPKDEVDILQSGSLMLVSAIARDAQIRATREADERARLMLDATPLCCNLWNSDFRVIDCNKEALNLFKAEDKREYLKTFFRYSPEFQPDGRPSREKAREYLKAAFRSGGAVFEWTHQTSGGEPIPSKVTLVRVQRGEEDIVAGYSEDLREYKNMMRSVKNRLAQQELMATISQSFVSRENMSRLVNDALREVGTFLGASRALIATSDGDGDKTRPVYVWSASEVFAIQPSKSGLSDLLKGGFPKTPPERGLVPAISCDDVTGTRYEVFQSVGVKAFIWSPQYVDGKYWGTLSVEDCVAPRTWSESDVQLVGMISGAIAGAVARDLYERERAEALEQAVKASKAKGDFLSNMSHEMRTPMNAIIGMTAIGKTAPGVEKKNYAFGKIEDASTHLLGVINDILDMSKIEANKLELSFAEFEFEKALQKAVNVVTFRVDEKRQHFRVNIDRAIPRVLIGDDQRLTQVVTNLLSNAVKFTPEGGFIRLTARLVGKEDGLYIVRIDVTDTGIGISPEQQSRLFTSFEQAESGTSRKFGGTGLGLTISKRIVEMMGGRIWIESELGKGATFAFTIQARRGAGESRGLLEEGVHWGNIRVLVVDDSPEILEYFADVTQRFGIACDTAASGEEAWETLQKNQRYDMYFVDWKMPGMNGVELARRIKSLGSGKSVVTMISGVEWSAIEDEARAGGVDKFLSKPLFPSDIANCINECLGMNGKERPDKKSPAQETIDFKGHKILLAEDVEINREIVLALLEPTDLTIDCAENGLQALEMFASAPERYEMIFMDVQMPEMDGYEATQRIRALDIPAAKRIPIVAMTANVFREDIEKCLAAGMNAHVGKPLNLDEVLSKLREYMPSAQKVAR
ncbi:MAG: response regulator [Synergistaceae bacterium]|jgi:signal transduction histidine kinase/CheY-like chemotaxis protein/PAS domain-containing protein|nr:response regulator [Synergistaceae bacterium]